MDLMWALVVVPGSDNEPVLQRRRHSIVQLFSDRVVDRHGPSLVAAIKSTSRMGIASRGTEPGVVGY